MNTNYTKDRFEPNEFASELALSDDELLERCDVFTFRAGGKGGQHVNKTESAVRLVHKPSGITVKCDRERSQHLNKLYCIRNLREKLEKKGRKKPKRVLTKIPKSVKIKRLDTKVKKSKKKELRRKEIFE